MNGNITKEGITADLEAMQRVGIGGAQIVNAGLDVPAGPVRFLSPQWLGMVQYAAREAERLGLTLGIGNCGGWSSSGGPWVTPEQAMQHLVTSEVRVTGPADFSGSLPQPPTRLDVYGDVGVLAYPAPKHNDFSLRSLSPTVTASIEDFEESILFDGSPETSVSFPLPRPGREPFVQFEFDQPLAARSVWITLGPGGERSRGVIQSSNDGQTFRDLQTFRFPHDDGHHGIMSVSLGNNPSAARFYRVQFTAGGARLDVAGISISSALCTGDVWAKSGMNAGYLTGMPAADESSLEPGLAIPPDRIIDLSSRMAADGQLSWTVPPGRWIIRRIGYTPTGVKNHPAPEGGEGLECDKLSAAAMDMHWEGFVQTVLDQLGPLAGKGGPLDSVLIDSYEVGGQNWTAAFRDDFRRLRGYDPLPWLVTITGQIVESPAATERFLWDLRRTIADVMAENYYGRFGELCRRRGLNAYIEPYCAPAEALLNGAAADVPVGEFWMDRNTSHYLKLASSIGHIYGRAVIGAESFTTAARDGRGRWLGTPYALKAVGDSAFCNGINQFIFHRYAMQPWPTRGPGMTMGPWGSHLERTVTWWEQGRAWMEYIARSQFLLRRGHCVQDAAAFCGEGAPVQMRGINPPLPAGYDYDSINADVLLNHASVDSGRLVLDSSTGYRILAFAQPERTMTPQLLSRLRDFVAAGLTLVGPPPERSPSLESYPGCDQVVAALAAELWGDCNGTSVTEHRFGKGRVVWGQTMEQVLASLDLKPDFEFAAVGDRPLKYIHRRDGDADIYFVSSQHAQSAQADCTFRVSGKVPELWHPDSGKIEDAPVWREENGRITVPLRFDPSGSVFVIFRRAAEGADHVVSAELSVSAGAAPPPPELVILSARYEAIDDSSLGRDVTARLAELVHNGQLEVRVGNSMLGGDPALSHRKRLRVEYTLDGRAAQKTVPEQAVLSIGSFAPDREPALQLGRDASGRLQLCASAPGSAELLLASGKRVKTEVQNVPDPVEISGPWSVTFPPNRGAPGRITLPKLMSWTDWPDNGVRWFSGTASYLKQVTLPKELFRPGVSLRLDLGQVKNIAEVTVNGRDLGVWWKPPFCADVTGALRPGDNRIEIKVTNLWPNRLIGDEHLPPDCEWNPNGSLKTVPQWVLDGKPSPTGRFAFTTWRHWHANDKLLPSGLLGPVTIQPEVKKTLQ